MIETLQRAVDSSKNIVFFGGAGVSTESGIPDFRSVDGLYSQKYDVPPETILSHSYFQSNTEKFYKFYKDKMLLVDAKPNKAHLKLADMEKCGRLYAVITQNIDGLHQLAGSKTVFELHGSVHRNYCMKCHREYDAHFMLKSQGVPKCVCGGTVKPDVVLYEEPLDDATVKNAVRAISSCDTLIIAGTSLTVYPAAGLINFFRLTEAPLHMSFTQNITHIPPFFSLSDGSPTASKKRQTVRNLLRKGCQAVLKEVIFIRLRKKAEQCCRIGSIFDAKRVKINLSKPYRVGLSST